MFICTQTGGTILLNECSELNTIMIIFSILSRSSKTLLKITSISFLKNRSEDLPEVYSRTWNLTLYSVQNLQTGNIMTKKNDKIW